MSGTTLLHEYEALQLGDGRHAAPPLLIRVPTISGPGSRRARRAVLRPSAGRSRTRRRLRREVWTIGSGLVAGALLATLLLAIRGGDDHRGAVSDANVQPGPEPIAGQSRSKNPGRGQVLDQGAGPDHPPVAFTGFLLPADGLEEPGHAEP